MNNQKALTIGKKVELTGGYNYDPLFLQNPPADKRTGTVICFIEGQNKEMAAVIRLDYTISGSKITGDMAVLELRYVDQTWREPGSVHIELCDFMPEDKPWSERQHGESIEAAAIVRVID